MKKLHLLTIAFILPILCISCKSKIDSRYIDEPVKIDGVYGDWDQKILAVDKIEAGLGVAHDDSNLFVCLVTSDRDLKQQILRDGLNVYISAGKKDKYAMGINFPLGIEMPPGGSRGQRPEQSLSQQNDDMATRQFGQRPDFNNIDMSQELKSTEFKMIYNKYDISIVPFFNNPYEIELAVKPSQNNIVYELKIPFSEIPGYSDETGIIKLGFEMAESKRPSGGEMPSGGGGMGGGRAGGGGGGMGGGPGGGGSGGRGGGQGGPGGGGMEQSSSQMKVWFKVNINQ